MDPEGASGTVQHRAEGGRGGHRAGVPANCVVREAEAEEISKAKFISGGGLPSPCIGGWWVSIHLAL